MQHGQPLVVHGCVCCMCQGDEAGCWLAMAVL
jgi:hypothetical protein